MDSLKKYRILCFGDSLTWGFDPKEKIRMSDENRYTAQLQAMLGDEYMVIEEGQNGRTIATDDPAEGEKNGLKYIVPCMETHNPIDLITVMLGSNDLKKKFGYSSMDIAGEMQIMLEKIQTYNTFRMNGRMKVCLLHHQQLQSQHLIHGYQSALIWRMHQGLPANYLTGISSYQRCTI